MGLGTGWGQYATNEPIIPIDQAFPLAAPGAAAGGGLSDFSKFLGGPAGMLTSAGINSFIGGFGQAQTAQSAQNAQQAAMAMFDANTGRSMFDRNYDYFLQRKAPIDEARIKMNPEYRRGQVRDILLNPGLAGKYSAFMA